MDVKKGHEKILRNCELIKIRIWFKGKETPLNLTKTKCSLFRLVLKTKLFKKIITFPENG